MIVEDVMEAGGRWVSRGTVVAYADRRDGGTGILEIFGTSFGVCGGR